MNPLGRRLFGVGAAIAAAMASTDLVRLPQLQNAPPDPPRLKNMMKRPGANIPGPRIRVNLDHQPHTGVKQLYKALKRAGWLEVDDQVPQNVWLETLTFEESKPGSVCMGTMFEGDWCDEGGLTIHPTHWRAKCSP